MKVMKTVTAIVAMGVALSFFPVIQAGAFHRTGHHGRDFGPMNLKNFLELNLSEEQRTELLGILEDARERSRELREGSREAMKALRIAMQVETFDEMEIREAFRKSQVFREELFVLRVKMINDIRKVLTDEQRARLKKKRDMRQEEIDK
jgi:Spy/CpxP family protein refolding chaperone